MILTDRTNTNSAVQSGSNMSKNEGGNRHLERDETKEVQIIPIKSSKET